MLHFSRLPRHGSTKHPRYRALIVEGSSSKQLLSLFPASCLLLQCVHCGQLQAGFIMQGFWCSFVFPLLYLFPLQKLITQLIACLFFFFFIFCLSFSSLPCEEKNVWCECPSFFEWLFLCACVSMNVTVSKVIYIKNIYIYIYYTYIYTQTLEKKNV